MNPIPASVIPPPTGLEKEEPEFAQEDDIPSDDDKASSGRKWDDVAPE